MKAIKADLTHEEKILALSVYPNNKGVNFSCPPPPVYTGNWSTEDWINYIDKTGTWLKDTCSKCMYLRYDVYDDDNAAFCYNGSHGVKVNPGSYCNKFHQWPE